MVIQYNVFVHDIVIEAIVMSKLEPQTLHLKFGDSRPHLTIILMFVHCFSSQAVWFGCDVGKHFERKLGALHLNM